MRRFLACLLVACLVPSVALSQPSPRTEGDYVVKNFKFRSGETLPELRLHYYTLGGPARDSAGRVSNAVLILHGTGGTGRQFFAPQFAGVLFGPGALLDSTRYYIILPDGIGHGHSSKPSDGLHAKFPHYDYDDMVAAHYALVHDHLGVNHLRLVMGTSMGGMQTWVWGETYPKFMDALMPLACLPVRIVGRNRLWRMMSIEAIRNDPEWKGGEYTTPPAAGLRTAIDLLLIAGSAPLYMQNAMTTQDSVDRYLANQTKTRMASDRCQRSDLPDRRLAHLRSLAHTRVDRRAAHPRQLGGRFHQSSRAGHRGARDPAGETRPVRADSDQREDARPRHAHVGGPLEAVPGRAAEEPAPMIRRFRSPCRCRRASRTGRASPPLRRR
jgi:homoserine O-acetyltransferase